jgi:hypothetical protein
MRGVYAAMNFLGDETQHSEFRRSGFMWQLPRSLFVVSILTASASAEPRWKYQEGNDDISNTKTRTVAIVGENDKSVLVLQVEQEKNATLTLVPGVVMFPDKNDVQSKTMGVQITMRSTVMEKPFSTMWRMPWMDYKTAVLRCKRNAVEKVFEGDSVTFQLDKAGKRFRFQTKGDGLEGLQDAVSKALEIAADDAPAANAAPKSK